MRSGANISVFLFCLKIGVDEERQQSVPKSLYNSLKTNRQNIMQQNITFFHGKSDFLISFSYFVKTL